MADASASAEEEPPTAPASAAATEEGAGGEGPTDLLLLKKAERRRQRDLYTALNLEEGASAEDVRGAYLRLAALMHPDKHGGGSALRADAEEQFRRIDRAYKVLTDPLMRQAYDLYGERGLRLLQALPQHELLPLRFPVEVSYLLEELSAEELQYSALSAQATQGAVTVDMAALPPARLAALPRLRQLTVEQQVEVPITGALRAFGGVYVVTRKAVGFGMGYVGGRMEVAKGTQLNVTYVMSQKNKLTLETAREFSKALSVRGSLSLSEKGSPELKLASSRRLTPTLTGTVDLAAALDADGEHEALGFALTSATGRTELTGKVRLAGEELSLKGAYEHRISHAVHLSFAGKVGNRGLDCSLAGTRTLSSLVAVTFGLKVALDGVTVTARLRKGRQQLVLPLKISAGLDPWSVLLGGVVGSGLNAALSLALRPFERARIQRRLRRLEEEATRKQAVERRHAAAQVRLMAATAARKREAEGAVGGLVILEAYYGITLPPSAGGGGGGLGNGGGGGSSSHHGSRGSQPDPEWYVQGREADRALDMAPAIDVRVPLQFFVAKGRLYLPPGSKAGVLGFYDVAANPTWLMTAGGGGASDTAAAAPVNTAMGRRLRPAPSFLAPIRPPGPPPPAGGKGGGQQHARLYVRYSYRSRVFEVTVDDIQPLELPPLDEEHTELGPLGSVA